MNQITESLVTIGVAIIGLATLAVIVSNRANTANVISSGASGFAHILGAAVSPVTGGLGYGGNFSGGFGTQF